MATYTENFDLVKPDDEDYYDVADFNANMDIIDAELGAVMQQANSAEIADKIGEPADTVLSTVFGKLNGFISPDGQGVRIIKSIQSYILTGRPENNHTININPVNAERCIVYAERQASSSNLMTYNYTLTDTLFTAYLAGNNTVNQVVKFWIIEFY